MDSCTFSTARAVHDKASLTFTALGRCLFALFLLLPLSFPSGQPGINPPFQAAGQPVYLPLLMGPVPALTSDDLIDQAQQAGLIDAQTALVYKFYALYSDSRLPAVYHGDDSQVRDADIADLVFTQWSSLSPATKATLAPFMKPPSAPGSWDELRLASSLSANHALAPQAIAWGTVVNPGSHVKVWYHKDYNGDNLKAKAVADAMDAVIWLDLTRLMGRTPLSDAGLDSNGGDGLLDIYLVHLQSGYGQTWGYDDCQGTASYMLINSNKDKWLLPTAAHEFMHVLQDSIDTAQACSEYLWLKEATATWAEDFVYPGDQSEQIYADDLLNKPNEPLESAAIKLHKYGAYLFPFFLARSFGQPALIKAIWDNTPNYDSLESIDRAIPGGFQTQWPLFARANWNKPSLDYYAQWDQLADGAKVDRKVVMLLGNAPSSQVRMSANVLHLGAQYDHFSFPDENIRAMAFYNPFALGAEPTANVQAVVRYQGKPDWESPQDWTNFSARYFCRDEPDERIAELVLIFSNWEWKDRIAFLDSLEDPRVSITNVGCYRYTGSITTSYHYAPSPDIEQTETTVTNDVVFERVKFEPRGEGIEFNAIAGTVSWEHTGKLYQCTGYGKGSFPAAQNGFIDIGPIYDANTRAQYDGSGGRPPTDTAKVTYTCPDAGSYEVNPVNPLWLTISVLTHATVTNQGTLEGSETYPQASGAELTVTWHLTPVRSP